MDEGARASERVPLVRGTTGHQIVGNASPSLRNLLATLRVNPSEFLPREEYAVQRPRLMQRLQENAPLVYSAAPPRKEMACPSAVAIIGKTNPAARMRLFMRIKADEDTIHVRMAV